MSSTEHPPPDPARLLAHIDEWERDETLPGQTMANLKKGGLAELLASTLIGLQQVGADTTGVAAIVSEWDQWERGKATPRPVLEKILALGLRDVLDRAKAAQEEAFGPA